jgi:hypothetical protein
MVNQTNQNVAGEIAKLNENETSAVLQYISKLLSARIAQQKTKSFQNDDLIVSLANAVENKRARQVFEWERVRRQNAQRAA